MMPPFVVFPTNRIAHFVEVSLYLFYLAQQVNLIVWNSKVSRTLLPKLRARMLWQALVFPHVPPFREFGSEIRQEPLPAAILFFHLRYDSSENAAAD